MNASPSFSHFFRPNVLQRFMKIVNFFLTKTVKLNSTFYQNNNGFHSFSLKSLKVGIQTRESIVIYGEVHLFIHVVNVCILHILWRDQCLFFFKCEIMFNKKQMNSPILIYVCIIRNVYEYMYKHCRYCFDSTVAQIVDSASNVLSALKSKKWKFFCLFILQLTCGMFAFLVRLTASCIFSILL